MHPSELSICFLGGYLPTLTSSGESANALQLIDKRYDSLTIQCIGENAVWSDTPGLGSKFDRAQQTGCTLCAQYTNCCVARWILSSAVGAYFGLGLR
jgi:hypothetical protein